MDGLGASLVFLHVSANVVWIGAIVSVVIVLTAPTGEPKLRGRLGVEIYKRAAVPAFVVSFVAGLLRLLLSLHFYFVTTKFMHGKLFLALVVIGLHHVIGARAKRMASGSSEGPGSAAAIAVVLLVAAVGAVFFAVVKPF